MAGTGVPFGINLAKRQTLLTAPNVVVRQEKTLPVVLFEHLNYKAQRVPFFFLITASL